MLVDKYYSLFIFNRNNIFNSCVIHMHFIIVRSTPENWKVFIPAIFTLPA